MPTPARPKSPLVPATPQQGTPNGPVAADDMQRQRAALLDDALDMPLPPPRPRRRRRVFLLGGAGLVMAVILAVVVMNIDRGLAHNRSQRDDDALRANAPPPAPGIDDPARLAEMQRDLQGVQSERAWIQATNNGRLAQEYRYAHSEPEAGGRLHLTKPEVKVYLQDNRVLTLRGETADVHAPSKAIESGTMNGAVVIRLYEVPAERQLDDLHDVPMMEVHTEEASYDNFQGEVHCPGWVDIQTPTAHLPAIGLRIQINDIDGRPGEITIDRINGDLRLAESAAQQEQQNQQRQQRPPKRTGPPAAATQASESSVAAAGGRTTVQPRQDQVPDEALTPAERAQRQRDRIRDRRATRVPQANPIQKQQGPYFYRLTLNQNVRIRQGDGTRGWTARGDQLYMIFSLDSQDLSAAKPTRTGQRPQPEFAPSEFIGPLQPMPPSATIVSLAVTSLQQTQSISVPAGSLITTGLFTPSDSDTIITCEGPLTMVPLTSADEQPKSADDSRFELVGTPVMLHNNDDASNIVCASLRYASLTQVLELLGSTRHPLVIDSPELHAEGEWFWIDRLNNTGAFEGPGWMVAGEPGAPGAATQPALPPERRGDVRIVWNDNVDLEFEQVAADRRAAVARSGSTTAPELQPATALAAATDSPPATTQRSGIAESNPHDSFGRLRLAMFNGDVAVQSPDFTLNADRMGVGFPARDPAPATAPAIALATTQPVESLVASSDGATAATQPSSRPQPPAHHIASIEFMHAEHNVVAGSLSDGGSIACDDLRVDFASHEGQTVPVSMLAIGDVAAIDRDKQTIWSDRLNVAFKPIGSDAASRDVAVPDAVASASQPVSQPDSGQGAQRLRRRADVDTLTATGMVQILMSDGARIFADQFETDGEGHRILISGEDVMVVSDRTIIHRGARLELTNRGERVLWPGAGEFSYYAQAVLAPNTANSATTSPASAPATSPAAQPAAVPAQRIARPVVDTAVNPRQMFATWSNSMVYDATTDDGGGSIVIRGNVNAESTPSALELNKLTGDKATLVFAKVEAPAATAPSATMPSIGPTTAPASSPTTAPASQPQNRGSLIAMNQRGRQLRKLIADGNGRPGGEAKLESRTWINPDQSDRPRVFYLSSQHVIYDDVTLEATVPSDGSLLVRDERPETVSTKPATQPAVPAGPVAQAQPARKASLPFGGKGTTLFRWNGSLHMTRRDKQSSLYDIVMLDGIEVRHQALDKTITTMTGDRLEATVDRSASTQQRDTAMDMGGSMDLRRIHALGRVYVNSPTRDIDCDDFDYDYLTGIAKLNARPDRVVTIITANNPHPVQAKSFVWNTIEDSVQASGVSGSTGK